MCVSGGGGGGEEACVRLCVYALRIVSTDNILCFINTLITIIYKCSGNSNQ